MSIGGQSIFDRGREAVLPLVEEIAQARAQKKKMVLGVGGGTRTRHTISIARRSSTKRPPATRTDATSAIVAISVLASASTASAGGGPRWTTRHL